MNEPNSTLIHKSLSDDIAIAASKNSGNQKSEATLGKTFFIFDRKRASLPAWLAASMLLFIFLHPGASLADCSEEVEKLKPAKNSYKKAATGKWPLPDKIKSLVRAEYSDSFEGGFINKFNKKNV